MHLSDQSIEYYQLRVRHERNLALFAVSAERRAEHLVAAARYARLLESARGCS